MKKKQQREIIFNKFGGRCYLCGQEITLKSFHVDEMEPCRRSWRLVKDVEGNRIWNDKKNTWKQEAIILHPERLHVDNQFPACASCNINKHSGSLEEFRNLIAGFKKHLNERNVQYQVYKRYGMVQEVEKPVVFYFETFNKP